VVKRPVMAAVAMVLLVPAAAQAAYPGANGKIAFVRGDDIWTMNPDGIDDGGTDGDAQTPAGDTLFAVQGVFVP
jgi:hypothetical protein